MIFAMLVLGGVSRLTGSGLSMVMWRPLTGWLPPLDAADWEALFTLYRETPEFQRADVPMTVDDFRPTFWAEYLHRVCGRLIGLAFVVPGAWFALRGRIGARLGIGLAVALLLGAAQGVLRWYMAPGGLADRPNRAQPSSCLRSTQSLFEFGSSPPCPPCIMAATALPALSRASRTASSASFTVGASRRRRQRSNGSASPARIWVSSTKSPHRHHTEPADVNQRPSLSTYVAELQ